MAEKRIVRGLLDVAVAEAEGVEWEVHPNAYPDKLKLELAEAEIARLRGMLDYVLKNYRPKPAQARRGRPKKDAPSDAVKAFACWQMLWGIRNALGRPSAKVEIADLIGAINRVEDELGVPKAERLFRAKLIASEAEAISRGKATLGIDGDWNSAECEEILGRAGEQGAADCS